MTRLVSYIPQNEHPPRGAKTTRILKTEDGRVVLTPGSKEMSDDEIKLIHAHFFSDRLKKQGALIIGESEIKTTTEQSLVDLDAKEAITLIGKTTDLAKLKQWQKDEPGSANRKTVLNAIASQIERIEKGEL